MPVYGYNGTGLNNLQYIHRETYIRTDRQTYRQTDRQTDRQAERGKGDKDTERQTDRQFFFIFFFIKFHLFILITLGMKPVFHGVSCTIHDYSKQ